MEGAELRQIRIVCQDNEPTVEQSQADDTVNYNVYFIQKLYGY